MTSFCKKKRKRRESDGIMMRCNIGLMKTNSGGSLFHSTMISFLIVLPIVVLASLPTNDRPSWTPFCPCKCDFDEITRKRVTCDEGPYVSVPINVLPRHTQVLIIKGSKEKLNDLTIGRIFQDFDLLEEVTITYSQIPAIGDSSFWPGFRLQLLDLSHNKISFINERDFNNLTQLTVLNLSHNSLSVAPSAAFRHLRNLSQLSLAQNKLIKLVPRMFFMLEKLELLDLSGNPLREIQPDDIKDAKNLKRLLLAGCSLTRLHSLVYQSLPLLEELDLRDNQFSHLNIEEYKYVPHLKNLLLDGNKLTTLLDNTFNGQRFEILSLPRNQLTSFSPCAFCGSSVKRMDISRNKIKAIEEKLFQPLKDSLIALNSEENFDLSHPTKSTYHMLRSLDRLKVLSIASMDLDDTLPEDTFYYISKSIRSLDMSGNQFQNISLKWLEPLKVLEELDISRNQISSLSEAILQRLSQMKSLRAIYMNDNPWSCFRCHILDLLDWIHTSPTPYTNVCKDDGTGFCVKCSKPSDLEGRSLQSVNELQLEWCSDPTVQLRIAASEPRVGLVLAVLIIIALVIVIITIVIMYKKQGATYYTHEDDPHSRDDKAIYTICDRTPGDMSRKSTLMGMMMGNSFSSPPPLSPPPIGTSPTPSLINSPPMSPMEHSPPDISEPLKRSASVASIPPPPPLPPPTAPKIPRASLTPAAAIKKERETRSESYDRRASSHETKPKSLQLD